MFSDAGVKKELDQFVRVRLYVGPLPSGHEQQVPNGEDAEDLRDNYFGNTALPYYVILQKDGEQTNVLGFYEKGRIDNKTEFAEFLKEARRRNGEKVVASLD